MTLVLPGGLVNIWLGTFGERWIQTICTVAGCTANKQGPDVFGADLLVSNADGEVIRMQVKTRQASPPSLSTLTYSLDVATYDRLRQVGSTPAYLIVVTVTRAHPDWTRQFQRVSSVRAVAHWYRITGLPGTHNTSSVTVSIPSTNCLTPSALVRLFA